jgi:hypothetical protein
MSYCWSYETCRLELDCVSPNEAKLLLGFASMDQRIKVNGAVVSSRVHHVAC